MNVVKRSRVRQRKRSRSTQGSLLCAVKSISRESHGCTKRTNEAILGRNRCCLSYPTSSLADRSDPQMKNASPPHHHYEGLSCGGRGRVCTDPSCWQFLDWLPMHAECEHTTSGTSEMTSGTWKGPVCGPHCGPNTDHHCGVCHAGAG